MFDKVHTLNGVEVLIHDSFGMWGRSSPFEDPSRLKIILSAGNGDELLWILQSMVEEKNLGDGQKTTVAPSSPARFRPWA